MKLKRKSSHNHGCLKQHSYMVYCTKLNPTEVSEQKYDWEVSGGGGGGGGLNRTHRSSKNLLHCTIVYVQNGMMHLHKV